LQNYEELLKSVRHYHCPTGMWKFTWRADTSLDHCADVSKQLLY